MARVRASLSNNDPKEAQELFRQLDKLPGRAQFDRLLSSSETNQMNRSSDPGIQARIDKMFADTRKLLGRFLSAQEISKLQGEVNAANRGT